MIGEWKMLGPPPILVISLSPSSQTVLHGGGTDVVLAHQAEANQKTLKLRKLAVIGRNYVKKIAHLRKSIASPTAI